MQFFCDQLFLYSLSVREQKTTIYLFRLLNLKNDNLRKKFDGIKYDLKKVEEVVYDLSIRGLNKPAQVASSHARMLTCSQAHKLSCFLWLI